VGTSAHAKLPSNKKPARRLVFYYSDDARAARNRGERCNIGRSSATLRRCGEHRSAEILARSRFIDVPSDYRAIRLIFFLDRLDHVFTLDAQPHRYGSSNEH
jgi:hypothetical protein